MRRRFSPNTQKGLHIEEFLSSLPNFDWAQKFVCIRRCYLVLKFLWCLLTLFAWEFLLSKVFQLKFYRSGFKDITLSILIIRTSFQNIILLQVSLLLYFIIFKSAFWRDFYLSDQDSTRFLIIALFFKKYTFQLLILSCSIVTNVEIVEPLWL